MLAAEETRFFVPRGNRLLKLWHLRSKRSSTSKCCPWG